MLISLIAAASENNVIGKNNGLPWNMPNDMKYFKNTTWGMPVIMGRKTFESMDEPLAGRMNIVITNQHNWKSAEAVAVKSWNDAIFVAKEADTKEVFVIGGGQIFKDFIEKADRIYLTRIHGIVDGDIFFPTINSHQWKLISKKDCFADAKHQYDYTFEIWEKA